MRFKPDFERQREAVMILYIVLLTFYRIKPVILGNGRCIQSDAVISGYEVPKGVRTKKSRQEETSRQLTQTHGKAFYTSFFFCPFDFFGFYFSRT